MTNPQEMSKQLSKMLPILFLYPSSDKTYSCDILDEIQHNIEKEGFDIQRLEDYEDLEDLRPQQHYAAYCVCLEEEEHSADNQYELLDDFIIDVRYYNEDVPVFLYGRSEEYDQLSEDVIRLTTGFIHHGEDTPEFITRYIVREARYYIKTSLPPFFQALMEYVHNGSYSWHCPGHSGGTAFLKSPVGKIFHQFFGENLLRADVCNAVESLGQLLGHTGHIGASERYAAHVFQADRLYFVTNGTSTSNKIVCNAHISHGDLVMIDRNCHQSILYAMIQTGAIPIFLQPSRNRHGIVGPILQSAFEPKNIRKAVKENPLVPKSYFGTEREIPKALILTQSTYDGVLYNAETIKEYLDGFIPVLHFDEAWIPHAVFHDFYHCMHAMGFQRRTQAKKSLVYSTQSTHKLLAGLSQASQILVQEPSEREIDPAPLQASFLMHTSTSPQYSILASLDVTSAMMAGPSGKAIVEEALTETLAFRKALRDYGKNFSSWWFEVWGPDNFSVSDPAESLIPSMQSELSKVWQREWLLDPEAEWHGFENPRDANFNMLDPIKTTLLTPGIGENGELEEEGIPAVLVSRYLTENGIIVEKTGLYSIFVMFTIGITKGRWKSLLSALQRFKEDYDNNMPLWRMMPELSQQFPQYADLGMQELAQMIHRGYRKRKITDLTLRAYTTPMKPLLSPQEAYNYFLRGEYKQVSCRELKDKVSVSMISIYPPGIPLVFPGELIPQEVQDYLECIEQQQFEFPGFEIHVHGVSTKKDANGIPHLVVNCIDAKDLRAAKDAEQTVKPNKDKAP